MKKRKKILVWLSIFALIFGVFSSFNVTSVNAASKKYGYLGGENGYQDLKLKCKGHKLYLTGYAWKTDGSKYPEYPTIKKKKINKTVKIGNDCKISIGTEPETNFKYKNKKKFTKYCGKENTYFSAPRAYVILKGNKAVLISLGA